MDTAAVAELLFDLVVGPRCQEGLRAGLVPLGDVTAWVAVLCGLHDLGKFSPAFQALRSDLALDLLGDAAASDIRQVSPVRGVGRTDTPHGLLTAVHLDRLLRSWGAALPVAQRLALVLGGHHGFFPAAESVRQARDAVQDHGREKWAAWRTRMVLDLARLWGLPDPSSLSWGEVQISVGAAVGLAGLASVSDWIASDKNNFDYAGPDVDLVGYVEHARELAQKAVHRLGWSPWQPPVDTSFANLFPKVSRPRPIQEVVERLVEDQDSPSVLIIEAPTGEGKTKAALTWAAALVRRLGLTGMYVGMPTKATSNQMFHEVETFLDDQAADLKARLLHSSAEDHLAAKVLRSKPDGNAPAPVDVGRDEFHDGKDGAVVAVEWFTRKRGLLAPVAVGTVDQSLKAAIRSRHVFVALAGLSGKVLVVDEVHAYETYMSTLLDRLLGWAGRLGIPVVLLSATLPSVRREELVRAWGAGAAGCKPSDVPALPAATGYPRLSWSNGREHQVVEAGVSKLNTDRTVSLVKISTDGAADWALAQVKHGGCVAVIHNLVRRVDDTHQRLKKAIEQLPEGERPELIVLTGQVAAKKRHEIEERLREAFGPESAHRPTRAIVVGTQVLEQSLDLDFDVMASDLAPIDSLIQRMGRLQRHRRVQGKKRVLAITGVQDEPLGPRFPPYTITVYQEILLLRTWALIHARSELTSPQEVPELVDAVYGHHEAVACPPGWERRWEKAIKKLEQVRRKDEADAEGVYLPQPLQDVVLSELTVRATSSSRTRKDSGRR